MAAVGIAPDLAIVCAYILGYANANRTIADAVAFNEMRVCKQSANSLEYAAGPNGKTRQRTFRDEHEPGALRHIATREYRLDNQRGERGYLPKDNLSAFPSLIKRMY